jgi:uncharacterized membrane protein YecN with MAPEG domain
MKEHAENGDSILLQNVAVYQNTYEYIPEDYLCMYYRETLKSYLMYHGLYIHLEFMNVILCCVFSGRG